MFAKKSCSEKYELHSYRRNVVIKLQQYLNEELVSDFKLKNNNLPLRLVQTSCESVATSDWHSPFQEK